MTAEGSLHEKETPPASGVPYFLRAASSFREEDSAGITPPAGDSCASHRHSHRKGKKPFEQRMTSGSRPRSFGQPRSQSSNTAGTTLGAVSLLVLLDCEAEATVRNDGQRRASSSELMAQLVDVNPRTFRAVVELSGMHQPRRLAHELRQNTRACSRDVMTCSVYQHFAALWEQCDISEHQGFPLRHTGSRNLAR